MPISPDWTAEERLDAISLLMARIMARCRGLRLPADQERVFHWARMSSLLAVESAAFLENNRQDIEAAMAQEGQRTQSL